MQGNGVLSRVCARCGRPARWSVTFEEASARWLCDGCLEVETGFRALRRPLSQMARPAPESDQCPACGTRWLLVEATALVGCPVCYEVFGSAIRSRFGCD